MTSLRDWFELAAQTVEALAVEGRWPWQTAVKESAAGPGENGAKP